MKNVMNENSTIIRFLTRLCDLILVNLLLVVCYGTVVCSGAVLASVYGVLMKLSWGEEAFPVKDTVKGIRSNFNPAFPATLLLFVDVTALSIVRQYLFEAELLFDPILWILLAFSALFLTAILSWLFPLIGRFENSFRGHFKNACLLSLKYFKTTLMITCVNLMPFLCTTAFPTYLSFWVGLFGLIGLAGGAYINACYLRNAFEAIGRETKAEGRKGRFE